jgi:hydrogenase-4 component H
METDPDRGIQTWGIFYGQCIYCARCEEVCPTGAIQLSHDFELAVMNKADLYERADFRMGACRCCGMLFAPTKEIEYVSSLLEQSGLSGQILAERRLLLELCPSCKRTMDLHKLVSLYQEADE